MLTAGADLQHGSQHLVQGGLGVVQLGQGGGLVLLAQGKVQGLNLGEELLLQGLGLLLLLLGLGLSQGVQVEAQGAHLAAQLLAGLSPVGLLDHGLQGVVNAGLGVLDALLGVLQGLASLGHAIAHILGQAIVTGLVDQVEAGVLDLAVIEQVHRGQGLSGGGHGQGSSASQEAGQDGAAGLAGGADHHGGPGRRASSHGGAHGHLLGDGHFC
mmetsp:Transcript_2004/g.5097  ORF Transcript_2004/g.5097 Transcript_2004/m.5097 type:complete len:213 (+) Transcript_2004:544-1182(+)